MLHRTQNPSGAAQFRLFREGVDYDSPMTFVAAKPENISACSSRLALIPRRGSWPLHESGWQHLSRSFDRAMQWHCHLPMASLTRP
jgi:hypothetical protein